MKCPYCTSEIAREALVCPVCRRDLFLFKPLLARIAELEAEVAGLPALRARLQAFEGTAPETAAADPMPAPPRRRGNGLRFWAFPLLLLLAAHALIVVAFDLNTLYLRLVSLLIPLPFGLLWLRGGERTLGRGALYAFAMAALAVFGMSAVVAYVDGVPWLPQGRGEWREVAEYAASIGFSALTGLVLGRHLAPAAPLHADLPGGTLTVTLARNLTTGPLTIDKLQESVRRVNEVSSSLMAIGTTALSVYTGLKGLLG